MAKPHFTFYNDRTELSMILETLPEKTLYDLLLSCW